MSLSSTKLIKFLKLQTILNYLFVRDVIAQSTIPPFQEFSIHSIERHTPNKHTTQHSYFKSM